MSQVNKNNRTASFSLVKSVNPGVINVRGIFAYIALSIFVFSSLCLTMPAARATDTPEPAATPEATSSPIRWSVSASNQEGPDGRTSIEHEVDPGQSFTDWIAVRNLSKEEVTFKLSAADGITTRKGRFDMLPSGEESVDAGTWIEIQNEVKIASGDTAIVPLKVTVPQDAEPGDHPAGVAASVMTTQAASDGTSMGVESRVGVKVLTRVKGDLNPAAAVENLNVSYKTAWNPLSPGSVNVTFDVVNEGNTRIGAKGTVEIGGSTVAFPVEGEPPVNLSPKDTHTFTVDISGVWPLFRASGKLTLAPSAAAFDGATPEVEATVVDLGVMALPWPQLIVVLGVVLILFAIFAGRKRSKNKLDAKLEEARLAGQKEALENTKE